MLISWPTIISSRRRDRTSIPTRCLVQAAPVRIGAQSRSSCGTSPAAGKEPRHTPDFEGDDDQQGCLRIELWHY
jgi:hypothetical protein